jgi:hypothetical protein
MRCARLLDVPSTISLRIPCGFLASASPDGVSARPHSFRHYIPALLRGQVICNRRSFSHRFYFRVVPTHQTMVSSCQSSTIVLIGSAGTEHRIQDRRALRLSALQQPFSPATGSMPQGTPLAYPERDRPLVTAFRSPRTIPAFAGSIPGSTFPACYFASSPAASPARSAFRLHDPCPVRPGLGRFHASDPLQLPPLASSAAFPAFAPLRDCYIPPNRSSTRFAANPARLPNPPDFLSLPATVSITRFRLRIIVPGPLRFRRVCERKRSPHHLSKLIHRLWH